MRGVRELEDGRVIIAGGFGGAVIVWTPGVGADTERWSEYLATP